MTADRYVVVDELGEAAVYRNWHHYYSPETFAVVLESNGFALEGCWTDLEGTPYSESAGSLGVVARKA